MAKQSYQVFDITLSRRTQVSPSLVRFTFTGPDVSRMATYAPDQRIKLGGDAQALPASAKVSWLPRDATPGCAHGERLLRAVRDIDLRAEVAYLDGKPEVIEAHDEPGDELLWEAATADDGAPFYAWIAAESKVALGIRRYLVNECGLPKRYVSSMGYWREGKVLG